MHDMKSSFSINPTYTVEAFIEKFNANFKLGESLKNAFGKDCLFGSPFPCATFPNFIQLGRTFNDISNTSEFLNAVESETKKLPFTKKQNDLYSFSQSCDIVNLIQSDLSLYESSSFSLLKDFRSFLLAHVLPWLQKLTGISLDENKVDLTSSIYESSDYLLCHDDELEGRRIAFIWYLVPEDWDSQVDGGYLQLFECDESDLTKRPKPNKYSISLPPERNLFAFFEVCPQSFHQVCEVLGSRSRLSLHGWFHGPSVWNYNEEHVEHVPRISPVDIEEELVYQWINPIYLDSTQQNKIRRRFYRSSEIQLIHFLNTEKWFNVVNCLISTSSEAWSHCGPFNRRNFHILKSDTNLPDILRQLQRLVKSEAMLVILSELTGIRLHPISLMDEDDKHIDNSKRPRLDSNSCEPERESSKSNDMATLTEPDFRQFQIKSYTLLNDLDMSNQFWRVDAILHLFGYGNQEKSKNSQLQTQTKVVDRVWQHSWGGQLVYVSQGVKEDLLTVNPVDNALTLVYTGPNTVSFVKYINHTARSICEDIKTINEPKKNLTDAVRLFDLAITYYDNTATSNVSDESDEFSLKSQSECSTSVIGDNDDDDDDNTSNLKTKNSNKES